MRGQYYGFGQSTAVPDSTTTTVKPNRKRKTPYCGALTVKDITKWPETVLNVKNTSITIVSIVCFHLERKNAKEKHVYFK